MNCGNHLAYYLFSFWLRFVHVPIALPYRVSTELLWLYRNDQRLHTFYCKVLMQLQRDSGAFINGLAEPKQQFERSFRCMCMCKERIETKNAGAINATCIQCVLIVASFLVCVYIAFCNVNAWKIHSAARIIVRSDKYF